MTETTTCYNQQAAAMMPGTILGGKYELLRQVGRGGMGVVWKARDRIADRLVALKFVPTDLARFETEVKRLRDSFQIVHELQHPSICPLYSLEDGGHLGYYHVMKYLEGETLDNYVTRKDPQRQGLPLAQVIDILSRVAAALDHAHSQGVIHRDIKPGNIVLVKVNNKIHVQVIDFGLADDIREGMIRTSQVQIEVSGTRSYMSPEQWRGRTQTEATDQYALAVVAYELLSGKVPFTASDGVALRTAVMEDTPEPVVIISDSTNAALQRTANAALHRALAKNAVDRFPNCNEFIAALSGKWTEITEEAPPSSVAASAKSYIFRWNGRLAVGLLLAAALGVVLGGRELQKRKPSDDVPKPTVRTLQMPTTTTVSSTVVTTLQDVVADDALVSLREAVAAAGKNDLGTIITFAAALHGQTVTLNGNALFIDKNVTIDAADADIAIDADDKSHVFEIAAGSKVTLIGLTITKGLRKGSGGGIFNKGSLTVKNCTISKNSTFWSGGGIHNAGTNASLTIMGSTISDNQTRLGGGGIDNWHGTVTIINCLISGNSASSGLGGGINNGFGTANVTNCTITNNSAEQSGGGIHNYNSGVLTLNNTIVAQNFRNDIRDSARTITGSNNLIGDGTGQDSLVHNENGNIIGTAANPIDPRFADVTSGDYRLAVGSFAVDAGRSDLSVDAEGIPLQDDLDGRQRIVGDNVDMGAYELH